MSTNKKKKNIVKTLISVCISLILIYVVYKKVDFASLWNLIETVEVIHFLIYMVIFIPIFIVAAWRWNFITRDLGEVDMSFYSSLKQTVGSFSSNLVVPAKMGEFIRVYWMKKFNLKRNTFWLIILEKFCDIIAISIILCFFLTLMMLRKNFDVPPVLFIFWLGSIILLLVIKLFSRDIPKLVQKVYNKFLKMKDSSIDKEELPQIFPEKPVFFWKVICLSVLLWLIHMTQFYFMFRMFGVKVPLTSLFSGVSLAVLSALFPFSIGGIGPRDAIIVWFFGQYASIEILVSVGILSATRVIVAGLAGIPWFFQQTRES